MAPKTILYFASGSPPARACLLLSRYLKLDVELKEVDLIGGNLHNTYSLVQSGKFYWINRRAPQWSFFEDQSSAQSSSLGWRWFRSRRVTSHSGLFGEFKKSQQRFVPIGPQGTSSGRLASLLRRYYCVWTTSRPRRKCTYVDWTCPLSLSANKF